VELSAIDFIVGGLILVLGLKGMLNGVIKEVFGLVAIAGGIYLASSFSVEFGAFLNGTVFNFEKTEIATLVGFVALLILCWGGIVLLGNIVSKLASMSALGFIDKLLGVVFASGKVFVIFSIIAYAITSIDIIAKSIDSHTNKSVLFPILQSAGEVILNIDPDMFQSVDEVDSNTTAIDARNLSIRELEEIQTKIQESTKSLQQLQEKVQNE